MQWNFDLYASDNASSSMYAFRNSLDTLMRSTLLLKSGNTTHMSLELVVMNSLWNSSYDP